MKLLQELQVILELGPNGRNISREGDDLPEDPSQTNGKFKVGQKIKADGRSGTIKKFGGDAVYVDHGNGKLTEYDISEIS